jgi:hypothetical protein
MIHQALCTSAVQFSQVHVQSKKDAARARLVELLTTMLPGVKCEIFVTSVVDQAADFKTEISREQAVVYHFYLVQEGKKFDVNTMNDSGGSTGRSKGPISCLFPGLARLEDGGAEVPVVMATTVFRSS